MRNKTRKDMLAEQKKKLNTYSGIFNSAVSVVTTMRDTLARLNTDIDETIDEIAEYQQELTDTTNELRNTKERNNKIVSNLEALLSVN